MLIIPKYCTIDLQKLSLFIRLSICLSLDHSFSIMMSIQTPPTCSHTHEAMLSHDCLISFRLIKLISFDIKNRFKFIKRSTFSRLEPPALFFDFWFQSTDGGTRSLPFFARSHCEVKNARASTSVDLSTTDPHTRTSLAHTIRQWTRFRSIISRAHHLHPEVLCPTPTSLPAYPFNLFLPFRPESIDWPQHTRSLSVHRAIFEINFFDSLLLLDPHFCPLRVFVCVGPFPVFDQTNIHTCHHSRLCVRAGVRAHS